MLSIGPRGILNITRCVRTPQPVRARARPDARV